MVRREREGSERFRRGNLNTQSFGHPRVLGDSTRPLMTETDVPSNRKKKPGGVILQRKGPTLDNIKQPHCNPPEIVLLLLLLKI